MSEQEEIRKKKKRSRDAGAVEVVDREARAEVAVDPAQLIPCIRARVRLHGRDRLLRRTQHHKDRNLRITIRRDKER